MESLGCAQRTSKENEGLQLDKVINHRKKVDRCLCAYAEQCTSSPITGVRIRSVRIDGVFPFAGGECYPC